MMKKIFVGGKTPFLSTCVKRRGGSVVEGPKDLMTEGPKDQPKDQPKDRRTEGPIL